MVKRMMDELAINGYIDAAEQTLQDDSEYKHWIEELVKEREELVKKGETPSGTKNHY